MKIKTKTNFSPFLSEISFYFIFLVAGSVLEKKKMSQSSYSSYYILFILFFLLKKATAFYFKEPQNPLAPPYLL